MSRFLKRLLTQSFPGKRDQATEAAGVSAKPGAEASDTESYESQAFSLWWERAREQERPRLLDLGTLRSGTLAFLGRRGGELSVLGLDPAEPRVAILEEAADERRFHGALCWDLLNFVEDDLLSDLGAWLGERLEPGAPVFFALATRSPYPAQPAAYDIVDERRLSYRPTDVLDRTKLLSGARLKRLWVEFEFRRSFLLRNGMQEYVLYRKEPSS